MQTPRSNKKLSFVSEPRQSHSKMCSEWRSHPDEDVPQSEKEIQGHKSRPAKLRIWMLRICTTLIFFSLPFWKTARKTTKKARISSACRTLKILGKEGKNAQNRKEFLEKAKGKENQKGKEKKIRAWCFAQDSVLRGRRSVGGGRCACFSRGNNLAVL